MRIHLITRWTIGGLVADRFRSGRVFVAGDAAHRHPPTGALGLTSAMHDVHNLCWKIAFRIRGWAGDALLDTYEDERRPVDSRNVERSLENSRAYAKMSHLLGFADRDLSPQDRWNSLARMWSNGDDDADHRRRVLEVMAAQSQEFREHDVEYGYRHRSAAVIDDDSLADDDRDFRLYVASTRPGSPLPHAWIEDWDGNRMSTLDMVDPGRFTVIAGEDGDAWCEAAHLVSRQLGVPIDAYRIGHARGDRRDPRLRWQEVRGISSAGMVLVRPDRCIAARSVTDVDDQVDHLNRVMRAVLAT
jgi:2,4-dichlorophenol 6-monooxygenase